MGNQVSHLFRPFRPCRPFRFLDSLHQPSDYSDSSLFGDLWFDSPLI